MQVPITQTRMMNTKYYWLVQPDKRDERAEGTAAKSNWNKKQYPGCRLAAAAHRSLFQSTLAGD